jgi:hypothetical protein
MESGQLHVATVLFPEKKSIKRTREGDSNYERSQKESKEIKRKD